MPSDHSIWNTARASSLAFLPSNIAPSHYSSTCWETLQWISLGQVAAKFLTCMTWLVLTSIIPPHSSPWPLPSSHTGLYFLHTLSPPLSPPQEKLLHELLYSFSLECYLMSSLETLHDQLIYGMLFSLHTFWQRTDA